MKRFSFFLEYIPKDTVTKSIFFKHMHIHASSTQHAKRTKMKNTTTKKTIQRSEESHHQNELVAHNHEDAMNSLPCSIHQMKKNILKFTTSEFILPIFVCEES